jgi:hypothetical protein
MGRVNFIFTRIAISCLLVAATDWLAPISNVAHANEADKAVLQKYIPDRLHRLDLSYTRLDTVTGELDVLLFGYTGALRPNMRIGITGGISNYESPDNTDEMIDEYGLSDTLVTFQYDPSERLTANPWIPDSAGLYTSLSVPTGDPDGGLGSDLWLANLGAGWPIDFIASFWLIPDIRYEFSFAEGDEAIPTDGVYASCAILWLFPFGGWIGYAPTFGREFETSDWIDSHALTVGKMWAGGFGLSLDIGKNENIGPVPARDDRTWLVNMYYQF